MDMEVPFLSSILSPMHHFLLAISELHPFIIIIIIIIII